MATPLDSTTFKVISEIVTKTVDKAFQIHPGDSRGGYEFAAGIMAIALLALAWVLYSNGVKTRKDAAIERESAAKDRAALLSGRSDNRKEVVALLSAEMATLRQLNQQGFSELRDEYKSLRDDLHNLDKVVAGLNGQMSK